jgi:hypothetical protein
MLSLSPMLKAFASRAGFPATLAVGTPRVLRIPISRGDVQLTIIVKPAHDQASGMWASLVVDREPEGTVAVPQPHADRQGQASYRVNGCRRNLL